MRKISSCVKAIQIKSLHLIILFGLIGCLTQMDFRVDIAGGRIVVSGQISTISEQNIIKLSVTANDERLPYPVSGASITLHEDTGASFSYVEDPYKPGAYVLNEVAGMPGRSYYVQIVLPNDKTYKSLPEKMPETSQLDSVYYEIINEDVVDPEGAFVNRPFVKVYANATLNSSANSPLLYWRAEETFLLSPTDFPDISGLIPPPCFFVQNADPQRITLFDGTSVAAPSVQGLLVSSRAVDWTFLEKHYFTVYQSSVTKESFEYWRKVNVLANQVGSIFDTPPASIIGNIVSVDSPSEQAFGFFQAVNQSYKRFNIHASDLPFPLLMQTCDFDGDRDPNHYPIRCIDCLILQNSSHERPAWF